MRLHEGHPCQQLRSSQMRTLIQILMAAAFVALMLGLRWGAHEVDLAWPKLGASTVFVFFIPLMFGLAVYLDRHDDGKAKDFWGHRKPTAHEYDFDAVPENFKSRALRVYLKVAAVGLFWLWIFALYQLFA
jgi:hypothetical protein